MILLLFVQTIEDDDIISFNAEFDSKFKRIRIPLISAKDVIGTGGAGEGDATSTAMPAAVEEDRRYFNMWSSEQSCYQSCYMVLYSSRHLSFCFFLFVIGIWRRQLWCES